MDKKRWQRVEAVFHDALDQPFERREAFVREACGDDEELFTAVMKLLAADESPNSFLDGGVIDAINTTTPAATTLPEGTRIGPYRIVSPLGTGGMGVVYLAERADGHFDQRVALKLIKRGMDSAQILARFHAERRILARLQHPNIAGLLDGGVTDDGLPYFSMEYVDGHPITEYCDEHKLTIEERLALFKDVCNAVQYAHGNLVVHRDLKPSNIMVTSDGHVMLLDFGIARMLDDEEDGLTRSGQRVMTPAYASPEQVRGEPVTTSTDVYSLGVVLYELLCGRHPHRETTITPVELERAIAETGAERPSRFLARKKLADTDTGPTVDAIAEARHSSLGRLRKRLEGDLDNICLFALRKEPERRYASPGSLREDIERHLAGRPVSARPDTVRYRFNKFLGRNRVGVALVGAFVLLIAAGTFIYTRNLELERDKAKVEAEKAKQVSDFLAELFQAADPYTSRGEVLTARELLDKGSERVHKELSGQPDVLAEMLRSIGTAYGNLGLYDEALSSLREAQAAAAREEGEGSHASVEAMVSMINFLNEKGSYEQAESLGVQAVELARHVSDKRLLGTALGGVAAAINYQGRWLEAEPVYRESIDVWKQIEGPRTPTGSPAMNNLALLLHEQSRYAEADSIFREALSIQEEKWGPRHPETATTRYNYTQLLSDRGFMTEARAMWKEVLATDRALYPEGHPYIAFTLSAYGRLLARMGYYEESEKLQREALDIRRKFFGEENADVAYSLGALGRVLYDQARYDEAEAMLRKALDIHMRENGPRHPVRSNLLNSIGLIQYARGDYAAADTSFANSLSFQRAIAGGQERNQMIVSLGRRAIVQAATGQLDKAESLARECLAMAKRLYGNEEGMGVAVAETVLAKVLLEKGHVAPADSLFAHSLDVMRHQEKDAPARPRDVPALLGHGKCLLARGDATGAERTFREALDINREYLRAGHPTTARTEIALARALEAQGQDQAARELLQSAIDALDPIVWPDQVDLVEARQLLQGLTTQ